MTDFRSFKGASTRPSDADLPRIGAKIGVGEDELHAFMDVEAAGSGFESQGRPKILFEPHVFYRNLSGSPCRGRPQAMVLAFMDSEAAHLDATVSLSPWASLTI
jgi:hypothetical protein